MAYKLAQLPELGPFACHSGDFYGNYTRGKEGISFGLKTREEHRNTPLDETLFRRGRPRPTAWHTSEELEAMGIVGIYLIGFLAPDHDGREIMFGPVIYVETPESMREPDV